VQERVVRIFSPYSVRWRNMNLTAQLQGERRWEIKKNLKKFKKIEEALMCFCQRSEGIEDVENEMIWRISLHGNFR
jgi:hypothetical protein